LYEARRLAQSLMNEYWTRAAASRATGVVYWANGSARLTQGEIKRVVDPFARNQANGLASQPSSFAMNGDSARGIWPVTQRGDPGGVAGYYVVDFRRSMLQWGISRFELVSPTAEVPTAGPCATAADLAVAAAAGEPSIRATSAQADEPGWVTRVYGKWTTVHDPALIADTQTGPSPNQDASTAETSGSPQASLSDQVAPARPPLVMMAPSSAAPAPAPISSAVPAAAATSTVAGAQEYRIAAGDKVKINTFGEDRFSGEFLVHRDGKITFPLFGDIPAAGLAPSQLASAISSKLAPDYLRDPRVTAEVISYRPVYILGEVARPGQYAYTEGMTMDALIAQAGGFSYRANRKRAFVRHDNESSEQRLDLQGSMSVRPGDTIRIPQRIF
jgi:polysaccharide export outer membrane protein